MAGGGAFGSSASSVPTGAPKDLIDRNIKKASDKNQADFQETVYEAYGPGGCGFIIEGLTDNLNRAAADVRSAVNKGGGKMAAAGSVAFNFKPAGQLFTCAGDAVDEDTIFDVTAEAGAEDVVGQPNGTFAVITPREEFGAVRAAMEEAGINVDDERSGLTMLPNMLATDISDEDYEACREMESKLLDLDDVDSVYSQLEEEDEED